VDPDDDEIQRYVVCRYAHDPQRHERRHQVVAAFDNKREFRRLLDRLAGDQQRRRDAGEPIDPSERFTGLMLEPGYRRRERGVRLLKKATSIEYRSPKNRSSDSTCLQTCRSFGQKRKRTSGRSCRPRSVAQCPRELGSGVKVVRRGA